MDAQGSTPVVVGSALSATWLVQATGADVGATREQRRRHRLRTLATLLAVPAAYLWWRLLSGNPVEVLAASVPHIDWLLVMPLLFFALLILLIGGMHVGAGRSPHVLYRPEQLTVRLDDVKGVDPVKEDVVRSLNLFLSHKTFAREMGGTPRRGLLFEGAPGTGKTLMAKAMAAEAGVPFLFVSATSFQSMFYGATARKIRAYFRALRRTARREGGVIGFIEEIDAIAVKRGGMAAMQAHGDQALGVLGGLFGSPSCGGLAGLPSARVAAEDVGAASAADGSVRHGMMSEGTGGVVNELLVQMQSFDEPTGWGKLAASLTDRVNLYLPPGRQLRRRVLARANVLLIAATNRADNLDPALLRPGRFDRRLTFDLPDKTARRELVDHFLATKSHADDLAVSERRDALASVTQGYTPVMIEHLLDEALVNALRRGERSMTWADVERARLVEEVGLGQPVGYTAHEKRLIATHEAGHAAIAWLVAPHRRLEVLTIVKRRDALGLLAHGDREDVYTRSRAEMYGLIQIAMAGQCAEERFFGDVSTGPGGDLLYATSVAAQMVGACGMTGTLVSYAAVQGSAISSTNIVGRVLADRDGRATVERVLQEQKAYVGELVAEHAHLVEALRDALLDRHELVGDEITDILERAAGAGAGGRVVDLRDHRNDGSARQDS
ncbi:MAG: AAA family ATPase [Actinomycetes bacterium]